MKTLIVGLGNPILGDDGVGWKVLEQIKQRYQEKGIPEPFETDFLAVGGLRLMERLVGYENVVLIDAITTGRMPPGQVVCLSLDDLPNHAIGHLGSAHDTSLHTALEIGRCTGAQLPEKISIVAIETENKLEFSEELTPLVAASVTEAVERVLPLILEYRTDEI